MGGSSAEPLLTWSPTARVEAVHDAAQELLRGGHVDVVLRRILVKGVVKGVPLLPRPVLPQVVLLLAALHFVRMTPDDISAPARPRRATRSTSFCFGARMPESFCCRARLVASHHQRRSLLFTLVPCCAVHCRVVPCGVTCLLLAWCVFLCLSVCVCV